MNFLLKHKVPIALGLIILFCSLFILSTCNTCTSKEVVAVKAERQTIQGKTDFHYTKGTEQTILDHKVYTGAEIVRAVKPLATKKNIGVTAKAYLQPDLGEPIRAPTVAIGNNADSGLYVMNYDIDNGGKLELKITTYPAVDSFKLERRLALTEKQLVRVDTLREFRVDTLKEVTTITQTLESAWWDKFWIGATALTVVVVTIIKAVE